MSAKRAKRTKQWSRAARYLALIVLLFLLALFLYAIREIIGPLVIAALLAYLLHPVVNWFHVRLRMKYRLAVFTVFWIVLIFLILLPVSLTPLLIDEMDAIEQEFVRLRTLVLNAVAEVEFLGYSPAEELTADSGNFLDQLLNADQLLGVLRAATENVIWVLVILITTYYLLMDGEKLHKWLIELFPAPYKTDIQRLNLELAEVWRYFLRGQLAAMLVIGIISGLAAALLGLPGAVALGLLALLLAVLPSVGSSIMIAVATLVALLADFNYLRLSPLLYGLLAMGIFSAIHLLENYWLRPRILGRRLHLHPGLILVAIIGALTLGGILEALLVVPALRSADIVGRYLMDRIFPT